MVDVAPREKSSARSRPVMRRRLAAAAALLLAAAACLGAAAIVVARFPRGLLLLAFVAVALVVGWYGLVRRGVGRAVGLASAVVLLVAAAALIVFQGPLLAVIAVVAAVVCALAAAKAAFAVRADLPPAPAPAHPVLFWNPKSGDGKAERVGLAEQARARGIEAVELKLGDDLATLVRAAVERGADALAMAGGDGSQAIVAAVASEAGLPYACIPAGTRNHFALDLGVDRDDVVGALDALVDGRERVVDLGEINGRVFVNNVSLGLYAEAVQQEGYRGAKIRTLLDTVPALMGPEGKPLDLRWTGPDGDAHATGTVILVSNNTYRLGRAVGSGTRPRIDDGLLGIAVLDAGGRGWRQWSARTFEVGSGAPVPIGMDGETLLVEPPLRFRIRPRALRVRIAPSHPGASPSAAEPDGAPAVVGALARLAAGR
ncbi:MAG TPA: diacylglycerol kinase family protein [Solirubrobacteraceae bacterium]